LAENEDWELDYHAARQKSWAYGRGGGERGREEISMQHYGAGEWTDYVRNLVSEKERIEMEEHRAKCPECEGLFEFLRHVAAAGRDEQVYEATSQALSASARRVFATEGSGNRIRERVARALQPLVAQLTYDSAADLRPAGARASRPTTRQMLYEAGDFCLDLRFDKELDSTQVTLVGQVAKRSDPGFPSAGLPVLILSSTSVVAQTASNEFGEFSLDYTPQRDLRLSVQIADAGVQFEVPVNGVLEQNEP